MIGLLALFALAPSGCTEPLSQARAQGRRDRASAAIITHRGLSRAGARLAIDAVLAQAARDGTHPAIAVVDSGGHLIAAERVDGSFAAAAQVSIGKAHTAAMFQRPTSFFEETIRSGRTPMIALTDFTPLQGGVPITVAGEVVGAVGVSGASSAAQDEAYATLGAEAAARAATESTP
jgi:glc operon protein GlcG